MCPPRSDHRRQPRGSGRRGLRFDEVEPGGLFYSGALSLIALSRSATAPIFAAASARWLPSRRTYVRTFGSWAEACPPAGTAASGRPRRTANADTAALAASVALVDGRRAHPPIVRDTRATGAPWGPG